MPLLSTATSPATGPTPPPVSAKPVHTSNSAATTSIDADATKTNAATATEPDTAHHRQCRQRASTLASIILVELIVGGTVFAAVRGSRLALAMLPLGFAALIAGVALQAVEEYRRNSSRPMVGHTAGHDHTQSREGTIGGAEGAALAKDVRQRLSKIEEGVQRMHMQQGEQLAVLREMRDFLREYRDEKRAQRVKQHEQGEREEHLISVHNIAYQMQLMREMRTAIIEQRFPEWTQTFCMRQYPKGNVPFWAVEALASVGIEVKSTEKGYGAGDGAAGEGANGVPVEKADGMQE
ncbi:Queuine tRNA-ribosyltransferase catalytic subunit 1 [Allomyces arbusculus]|nr:Queuine tRNA-ribosyltransferase catalytic subunit 1 [Allomyces arbusculus]